MTAVQSQQFPKPHWGREGVSPLFKPAYAFASTAPGSWVIRHLVPLDQKVMNRTNGRYTLFGPTSLPQLLLITTGRKSGLSRSNPLSYLSHGDQILVLASNFGGEAHPGWSSNLMAVPDAEVSIAGETIPVTAELLAGAERDDALAKFFAYPMYAAYRRRTDRNLRIFALSRR